MQLNPRSNKTHAHHPLPAHLRQLRRRERTKIVFGTMTVRGRWRRQRHTVPRNNNSNNNLDPSNNNNNSNSHRHNNCPSRSNLKESVAAPPRY